MNVLSCTKKDKLGLCFFTFVSCWCFKLGSEAKNI
jgi:hypothetical protein